VPSRAGNYIFAARHHAFPKLTRFVVGAAARLLNELSLSLPDERSREDPANLFPLRAHSSCFREELLSSGKGVVVEGSWRINERVIFFKDSGLAAEYARQIRRLERIPTLETQLIQAFRIIGRYGGDFDPPYTGAFDLRRGGFHVYIRSDFWRLDKTPLWVLTVGTVEVPPRYWGRGWFRNFSEIVYHTMPHNALVLENVMNEAVYAAFSKKPDYIPFNQNSYLRSTLVKREILENSTLRPSDYHQFRALNGQLSPPDFSPEITRFPGHSPPLKAREVMLALARGSMRILRPDHRAQTVDCTPIL
jgi:hypothetical protein